VIRTVKAEILDHLPRNDPAVSHTRRDLLIINALMGNHRWILGRLPLRLRPKDRILEIGSGDGTLARRIDCLRGSTPPFHQAALDQTVTPVNLPERCTWHQADIFDRLYLIDHCDLLVANLFLHHFVPDQLATIGRSIHRGPRVILACEPVRRRLHIAQLHALRLMRVHPITRHDARVSIEAGFRGKELPHLLNLDPALWQTTLIETFFGGYRMLAVRR
jgi:hypothetical protein